ncbi:MAG: chemotaxis protein CheB [Phycisphaerales bacterium]|nr:chemotaxis protein CheB [Hyphomonadaceae bacterium]
MATHPIIVIGASEGGVSALRGLHAALPENLPAAVFFVLHIGAHDSELPEILNGGGPLLAAHPNDGDPIRPGRVYVAPPDRHMMVADGAIRLTKGPRENFVRPSIDPLFRSAAESYGPGAVGVILTGGLNDGTAGLYEIKRRGGVAVVQDPSDATNPSMPRSALSHVAVDHCEPLALIPQLLQRIVAGLIASSPQTPSEGLESDMDAEYRHDQPVAVTCPDCGGALRQTQLGTLTQFRCHIGHVYTAEAMVTGQFRAMEQAMEAALRSISERAKLCREMAELTGAGQVFSAQWRQAMDEAHESAAPLRELLEREWIHPPLTRPHLVSSD